MTPSVLGPAMNLTAPDWDNFITRSYAQILARKGTCPWCGRTTTTPARTLLGRFEPTLHAYESSGMLTDWGPA
jgi:hypothetical protein